MGLKQRSKKFFSGWLPKGYSTAFAEKMSKLRWWRPFWTLSAVGIVVAAVVTVLLLKIPLERALPELGFAFACLGIAYYIRVRPAITINRAVYVLIGVTPLGFVLGIIWAFSVGTLLMGIVGSYPALLISLAVWCPIGAFIGDWLGKKRSYQLPPSP